MPYLTASTLSCRVVRIINKSANGTLSVMPVRKVQGGYNIT